MSNLRIYICFLLALAIASCAGRRARTDVAQQVTPATEQRYPRTVAEAVTFTLARMNAQEKSQLKAMRQEDIRGLLHGFQMTARNEFGLSSGEGNRELLRSCGSETMILEDCLLVILEAAWVALNKVIIPNES